MQGVDSQMAPVEPDPVLAGRSVLFIDDEPHVISGLKRMLRGLRCKWDITFANGGEEALALLRQRSFDVVVTDMRMPVVDGASVLTYVAEEHPDTIRLVLTGQSERELLFRSLGTAHQFLSKPCDAETLQETVERALKLRNTLHDGRLEQYVANLHTLPSVPELYRDITAQLDSPEPSIKAVAALIERDMGMSARVLQVVNSPYFGLRTRVTSASQAAMLLGIEVVRTLVLGVHLFSELGDKGLPHSFPGKELWHHSLTVASFAKELATAEGLPIRASEEAFTAGLMHDLGKVVLASGKREAYAEVIHRVRTDNVPWHEAELEILGVTHTDVGGYILKLWGLPDAIVEAVTLHHDPVKSVGTRFGALSAVTVGNVLDRALVRKEALGNGLNVTRDYLARLGCQEKLPAWIRMFVDLRNRPQPGDEPEN